MCLHIYPHHQYPLLSMQPQYYILENIDHIDRLPKFIQHWCVWYQDKSLYMKIVQFPTLALHSQWNQPVPTRFARPIGGCNELRRLVAPSKCKHIISYQIKLHNFTSYPTISNVFIILFQTSYIISTHIIIISNQNIIEQKWYIRYDIWQMIHHISYIIYR